jgi:hypothetical protein
MTQKEFRKKYDFNIKTDNIDGGSFGTVYKAYDNILGIKADKTYKLVYTERVNKSNIFKLTFEEDDIKVD